MHKQPPVKPHSKHGSDILKNHSFIFLNLSSINLSSHPGRSEFTGFRFLRYGIYAANKNTHNIAVLRRNRKHLQIIITKLIIGALQRSPLFLYVKCYFPLFEHFLSSFFSISISISLPRCACLRTVFSGRPTISDISAGDSSTTRL